MDSSPSSTSELCINAYETVNLHEALNFPPSSFLAKAWKFPTGQRRKEEPERTSNSQQT